MNLEEAVNKNMSEWMEHCSLVRYSSNIQDYLRCEAYKNIVSFGKEIFPCLYKITQTAEEDSPLKLCLPCLVRDIAGDDFQIPKEMRGRVDDMWNYTIEWLEMHK